MVYNIIKLKHIINKTVKGGEYMIFNINAALLDALVLAIVKKEDTYGYEITRVIKRNGKSRIKKILIPPPKKFFRLFAVNSYLGF